MPVHTIDRRQQILDTATRLFSNDGYQRVTMKQLAEACGVTEAALYKHFESKAQIYAAVLESIESRLEDADVLNGLGDTDDVEKLLRGLARHILSFFGENEYLYRLLLYSALEGHEKAQHVFTVIRGRYIQFLSARLDVLRERGMIAEKNNEITARCFIGMVFDCALGFSLWRGMQGTIYEPSVVVDNNVPIYAKGLKPQ